MKKVNNSRRNFLKSSSLGFAGASMATATTGGITGLLSVTANAAETNSKTVVTAAHWGPLGVVVENGKVVKSGPAIAAPIENELQSVVADQLYSEARVKYPMVRKGYLDGNQDRSLRGHDTWVRVSWEQAFDLVAK